MKKYALCLLILFMTVNLKFAQSKIRFASQTKSAITGEIVKDDFEDALDLQNPSSFMPDSLDKNIDVVVNNKKLTEIFNIIAQKTGTAFIYDSKLIDNDLISVNFRNRSAKEILHQLLDKYEIGFVLMGNKQVVLAQNKSINNRTCIVKGKVTDENNEALFGATVMILENKFGCATNDKGNFEIGGLKPGTYNVKVSYLGYKTEVKSVELQSGKTTVVNYILKNESFLIGEIKVVANNDFIPVDPETKSKINSGEIEHMQASSLNDVMKLAPGTRLTNPTLNSAETASIRGGNSLGTQIMIDGIPLSNNSNMQIGVGYSTANSGIDLRSIPAENIENVDIIRGIPSAKYGDLADGLMIVKTKSIAAPLNAKIKYNPNVYEFNLSGGVKLSDSWIVNGNFNLASSGRDIRIEGDGYTRIALQLNTNYDANDITFKNAFYITRTFDEMKEQPGYALRESWYNRDINFRYNGNFTYTLSSIDELNVSTSISFTGRDSYNQQLVSRDNIVISDRITEGSQEGIIVFGSYLGKKWIKGSEWDIYSSADYKTRFFLEDYLNNINVGISWRNEFNVGEGIVFDPLYPPSLSTPSPRIRTYNDLPAYGTLSLFAEDRITGNFIKPFTLQVGARYEVYRPTGFDVKGLWGKGDLIKSNNGSFLNPRVNFSVNLFEMTQLRLSYGVTTKSPPMGMIFAQEKYFDVIDTVSIVDPTQPDKNFSIVSTYIKKTANPELKAYKQYKYEFSIDQQIGSVGFTLTGFINDSRNMFRALSVPTVLYKYSYQNWPLIIGAFSTDTLMYSYPQYVNDGYSKTKGFEFSFSTSRIPVINTIFKLDAAYYHERNGSESGYNLGTKHFINALNMNVIPMYKDYESYSKNLLLNYRFEIQTKSLGMWITLHIQQQLIEIDGRNNYDDFFPIAYFTQTNQLVTIPEVERSSDKYKEMRRSVEDFELLEENRPNIWLFNLKVSKALWKGGAISFFVNNFFNNRPLYLEQRTSPSSPSYERRNPPIFYGMEFSSTF